MSNPLRFEITDWHQAVNAMSNNSVDLKIKVTDFINDERLSGTRISIWHPDFGTLFSCVVCASGTLITDINANMSYELTTEQILKELEKYGFIIVYKQKSHLPEGQLAFLRTLQGLGYDKLRILDVSTEELGKRRYKAYIIVFNVAKNPTWVVNTHIASESEFLHALQIGSAVNISEASRQNHWDWGWLDFVANISDILEENAS